MADQQITNVQIAMVARNPSISSQWEVLASLLDANLFNPGMTQNINTTKGTPFLRTQYMLTKWHGKHAGQAKVSKLIIALCNCEMKSEAEEVFGASLVASVIQNASSDVLGGPAIPLEDPRPSDSKPSDTKASVAASAENMLDVVIVTAVPIELQAVKKVLEKVGCTSFPDYQIRNSSGGVEVGGIATKLQLEGSTFNVGVFLLLQMGHVGTTNLLQAIKYGVESKQVSGSGLLVMIGMCAGNPDKVKVGTIMTPSRISKEGGEGAKLDAETGKREEAGADAKIRHAVLTAVQAASPQFCGYDWLRKYLPDEVKNTPSPPFLQDAILAALKKVHPNEMNVTEVLKGLFSAYENWPENVITKEVVKEALGILKREHVTENGKKFSINEKGINMIDDIESDSHFPRSDPPDPAVNNNPIIAGDLVRVGMTPELWGELKGQVGQRKASGFEMEGYGFLRYAEDHLTTFDTWFVKVVTDYATKQSKMDYYQYYGACLAAAFFVHVLEKNKSLAARK